MATPAGTLIAPDLDSFRWVTLRPGFPPLRTPYETPESTQRSQTWDVEEPGTYRFDIYEAGAEQPRSERFTLESPTGLTKKVSFRQGQPAGVIVAVYLYKE